MRYCLGFAFDPTHRFVAMIRKDPHPIEKFTGLWNGLGGEIEPYEVSDGAMLREFYEEASIEPQDLRRIVDIHFSGQPTEIICYSCQVQAREHLLPGKGHEPEGELAWIPVSQVLSSLVPLVPHTAWLTALALHIPFEQKVIQLWF